MPSSDQIRGTMRVAPRPYVPLIGTLFLFILAANWSSLMPGVEPPTAHIETDAALGLIVFFAIIYFGIRARGLGGYLKTFAEPTIVMIPLNIVETFTRTFSLIVRLFGNVMSGVFIIGIVLSLAGLLVPIPLMALDLLTGAVQAYIFTVLAMVFIGSAVERRQRGQLNERKTIMNCDRNRQHPRRGDGRVVRRDRAGARRRPRRRRRDGRHRPPARGGRHPVAHAVRRPRHDRDDGDLLPGDRAAGAVRQPFHPLSRCTSTGGRWRSRPSTSWF